MNQVNRKTGKYEQKKKEKKQNKENRQKKSTKKKSTNKYKKIKVIISFTESLQNVK